MHINKAIQVKGWLKDIYGKAKTTQLQRIDRVINAFYRSFQSKDCYVCSSSGRVELIGNHLDHNGGQVIACTIDRDIVAAFRATDNNRILVKSTGYKDISFDISQIDDKEINSSGMAKGVVRGLLDRGYQVGGLEAVIDSMVPSGAGMSSSASFQLLIGRMLAFLYNDDNVDGSELAKIGQFAENEYFNKPCGLMDQATIGVGGIVKMDFAAEFCYERIAQSIEGCQLVVVNTGGSHAGLTKEYSALPQEMQQVANYFGCQRLCQVDKIDFFDRYDDIVEEVGQRPALRAKHYFDELERVVNAEQAIKNGDRDLLLHLIKESGLSSIYQLQNVTYGDNGGKEMLDALNYCGDLLGDMGAVRVHGGGFAGTILLVIKKEYSSQLIQQLVKKYGNNVYPLNIRSVGTTVLTS